LHHPQKQPSFAAIGDKHMSDNAMVYFEANRPAQTLIPAIRSLVSQPREFFSSLPNAIYYRDSLLFVSIIVFLLSVLSIPFHSFIMLFAFPITLGIVIIGMWSLSRYLKWAASSFAKTRLSATQAFQISAYAFLPMACSTLSWFGIVALLASMYLLWLGLVANRQIKSTTAWMIVAVPFVFVAMLGSAVMVILSQITIS